MKKIISVALILVMALALFGCQKAKSSGQNTTTKSDIVTNSSNTTQGSGGVTASGYNPYATENNYSVDNKMFKKQSGVDYGTIHEDVTYYSTTAGDNKQCNA